MKTLFQVHVAEGRPFYMKLFPYRRAQRAVRLLKHFGFKDAYIAGKVFVGVDLAISTTSKAQ